MLNQTWPLSFFLPFPCSPCLCSTHADPWQVRKNCVLFLGAGVLAVVFHVGNPARLPQRVKPHTNEWVLHQAPTSYHSAVVVCRHPNRKELKVGLKRNMKQISSSARLLVRREEDNRYAKYIPVHSAAWQRTFKPSPHACLSFLSFSFL